MGTRKRYLSGLLAAALVFALWAGALSAWAASPGGEDSSDMAVETIFNDVPADAWYAAAVEYCLELGLMNGVSDTDFDPSGTMTRSMLATVLYRAAGSPAVTGDTPFPDVDMDSWYGPAALWAYQYGVITGYGNGLFGTDDPVTREQLAVILWRYAGIPEPPQNAEDFADEDSIDPWANEAVDWARENGILNGRDGNRFDPQGEAQRCEVATVLMNYMEQQAQPEPEPDPSPSPSESPDPEPSESQDPDASESPDPGESEDPEPSPSPEPEMDPWEEFYSLFGYIPTEGQVYPNPYLSDGFQVQTSVDWSSYMTYAYGPYAIGIDVSSHQEVIDWEQVAASGVQFAMIRAGYRGYTAGTLNKDRYFVDNIEGALDAGLDVGVYFFSQAVTVAEAIEEAEYLMELVAPYQDDISYPLVFDWERQSVSSSRTKDTSEEMVVACAVAFCETVKAAGYIPMFYASPSKAYTLDMGYLSDYPFWLAHYTRDQAPSSYRYTFDMWQYSSSWRVPGIDGDVDVNICLTPNWSVWQ